MRRWMPPSRTADVKGMLDAIKAVRAAHPQPAEGFGGATPKPGKLDADALAKIVGHSVDANHGSPKITIGATGHLRNETIGASMGLTTWAAFSGSDQLAAMDGDFIMRADEVQPVLHALRKSGIHIVALHNHMIGTQPDFYFTHFWGKGKAADLARGLHAALDAQAGVSKHRFSGMFAALAITPQAASHATGR